MRQIVIINKMMNAKIIFKLKKQKKILNKKKMSDSQKKLIRKIKLIMLLEIKLSIEHHVRNV